MSNEPAEIVEARRAIARYRRNGWWGVGAVTAAMIGGFVGTQLQSPAMMLAGLVAVAGSLAWFTIGGRRVEPHRRLLIDWRRVGREQAMHRAHERAAGATDPRIASMNSVAGQLRGLPNAGKAAALVAPLQARLTRLVADEATARAARAQLSDGSDAATRLDQAIGGVTAEIQRILEGTSELYAALLNAPDDADPLADLTETLAFLEAEAEIDAEAMRPAAGARAARTQSATE